MTGPGHGKITQEAPPGSSFTEDRMKTPRLSALAAALLVLGTGTGLRSQDRVALVIGNNAYPADGNFPSLDNCSGDSTLIKDTLASLGFRVFHAENATRSEMDAILTEFENAIPRGGTAVFYFAGHGIEFDGKNYLMGSNAKLQARSRLGEEAMDAETFASAMLVAGAKSSFLFLDCCREVPKEVGWLTRGTKKRGLAELNIDGDIIIAYAAKPGQAALDGQDGNSPYAKALARWLPSGLKHGDLFDQVRLEVHETTGGAQRTWESGSFLEPFFFKSGTVVAGPAVPPSPPAVASVPARSMTAPNSPAAGKAALERFRKELSAAIRKNPNPPVGAKSSEQLRQFRVLAGDLVSIDTAGLPPDLVEVFDGFRDSLERTATTLGRFPDLDWDDAQAVATRATKLLQSDPDLAQTLATVPDLARECQAAGSRVDEALAKYGLVVD